MIGQILLSFLTLLSAGGPQRIDWGHPDDNPVRLRDNGFCAGISWITLLPGEIVTVDYGPDFSVYRVRGPSNREWGVYSGFAGQSRPDRKLLTKSRTNVYRGTEGAAFNGYFVGTNHEQNHFFGNVFKDTPADARFFDRVSLGKAAKSLCAKDSR